MSNKIIISQSKMQLLAAASRTLSKAVTPRPLHCHTITECPFNSLCS